jgi:hypothetical protein
MNTSVLVEGADFQFVQRQFPVGIKRLKNLLVILKDGIAAEELQNLFNDVKDFVFNLVKNPLVKLPRCQDPGVFQIDQVPGGLGLGKFENVLQVGNTHFPIGHDQVQDAEPRRVGAGQKNLGT